MDSQDRVNRPKGDAFRQQKLRAWQPMMSPFKVVMIFFLIGISFIPTGNYLLQESNDVSEVESHLGILFDVIALF
ncbi:hypothetical protein EON65_30390 [archaeon]|nr:MAG: hypothetical protein EON65_30390 [archaeon]